MSRKKLSLCEIIRSFYYILISITSSTSFSDLRLKVIDLFTALGIRLTSGIASLITLILYFPVFLLFVFCLIGLAGYFFIALDSIKSHIPFLHDPNSPVPSAPRQDPPKITASRSPSPTVIAETQNPPPLEPQKSSLLHDAISKLASVIELLSALKSPAVLN